MMSLRLLGSLAALTLWAPVLPGAPLLSAQTPQGQGSAQAEKPGTQPFPTAPKDPFANLFSGAGTDMSLAIETLNIGMSGARVVQVPPATDRVEPRQKCHIRQIEVDPDVDPKIHIQIPEETLKSAKIRMIAPPPCHK